MITVKRVEPKENYILELEFNNSEIKYFDMKEYLNHGIFKELENPKLFNSVKVFFETINWDNGADLCPEVLYKKSTYDIKSF
ncbi:MAG: DUF2442 domain-containing protein [Candidatus Kapabacteria bacterium]|nr:DUF2442 domain-containing protein [Candidatus Kapabacteria bacterium]